MALRRTSPFFPHFPSVKHQPLLEGVKVFLSNWPHALGRKKRKKRERA
jgi:hypothetical protein